MYRIQYEAEDGFVHFSYLPPEKKHLHTSQKNKGGAAAAMSMNTGNGNHVGVSKGGEDDDMRVDDNQGFEPQLKRAKLVQSGF